MQVCRRIHIRRGDKFHASLFIYDTINLFSHNFRRLWNKARDFLNNASRLSIRLNTNISEALQNVVSVSTTYKR